MNDALTTARPDTVRLDGATLTFGGASPIGPMAVVADGTGFTFWRPGEPGGRALPWHRVRRVQVDAGDGGTTVLVATERGDHCLWVPGADPGRTADGLAALAGAVPVTVGRAGPAPAAVPSTTARRRPPSAAVPSWFLRARPVLTVVLVLVVATMVALVLADSTGAVHLGWLGGSGGGQLPPAH